MAQEPLSGIKEERHSQLNDFPCFRALLSWASWTLVPLLQAGFSTHPGRSPAWMDRSTWSSFRPVFRPVFLEMALDLPSARTSRNVFTWAEVFTASAGRSLRDLHFNGDLGLWSYLLRCTGPQNSKWVAERCQLLMDPRLSRPETVKRCPKPCTRSFQGHLFRGYHED